MRERFIAGTTFCSLWLGPTLTFARRVVWPTFPPLHSLCQAAWTRNTPVSPSHIYLNVTIDVYHFRPFFTRFPQQNLENPLQSTQTYLNIVSKSTDTFLIVVFTLIMTFMYCGCVTPHIYIWATLCLQTSVPLRNSEEGDRFSVIKSDQSDQNSLIFRTHDQTGLYFNQKNL